MRGKMIFIVAIVLIAGTGTGWGQSSSSETNVGVNSEANANVGTLAGGNVGIDNSSGANATGGSSNSTAVASGGSGGSGGNSNSTNLMLNEGNRTSLNFEASEWKTGLLGLLSSYLPYWNHGGWGVLPGGHKGVVFYNGPSEVVVVYERVFDPYHMGDVYGALDCVNYKGPLELFSSIFSRVSGSNRFLYEGKGFKVTNSIIKKPRPEGKHLLVFLSNGEEGEEKTFLDHGYVYVNGIGIEGDVYNCWDNCYNTAVAGTIPWDVDILVISGGMKGVTIGSSSSNGVSAGTSQKDFSVSAGFSGTSGMTEGAGKGVVRAKAYRYSPEEFARRNSFNKYLKGGLSYADLRPAGYTPRLSPSSSPSQEGIREQRDNGKKKKVKQQELNSAAARKDNGVGIIEVAETTTSKNGAGG